MRVVLVSSFAAQTGIGAFSTPIMTTVIGATGKRMIDGGHEPGAR